MNALPYWTPDLVVTRLARGVYIAIKSEAGRVGPRGYSNSMPDYAVEFSDKVRSFKEALEEFLTDTEREAETRFASSDIADADEALTWPGRYLANEPLLRDALWIRALADAANIKIDRLLHRRRVKADAMLNRRKEDMPDIVRIYEDDARDVATKVVAWANAAMAKPLSEADIDRATARKRAFLRRAKRRSKGPVELAPDEMKAALASRNAMIRQSAAVLFRRDGKKAKVVERITRVRRQDVIEGKHFSPRSFYRALEKAAAQLADALTNDAVPVE